MSKREAGRLTARNDEEIVVFLIGARVNKWWLLPFAIPILSRMRAMQMELLNDPDSGLLGMQSAGSVSIQYWRSVDKLLEYANARNKEHKPAWKRFYKKLFPNESVGVWHETFIVSRGHYESMYVNMPRRGLGTFFDLSPATGEQASSRGRLAAYFGGRSEGAPERRLLGPAE